MRETGQPPKMSTTKRFMFFQTPWPEKRNGKSLIEEDTIISFRGPKPGWF